MIRESIQRSREADEKGNEGKDIFKKLNTALLPFTPLRKSLHDAKMIRNMKYETKTRGDVIKRHFHADNISLISSYPSYVPYFNIHSERSNWNERETEREINPGFF